MKAIILSFALFLTIGAVIAPQEARAQREDLTEFDHLDPKKVVPDRPFRQALAYYKRYKNAFPNKDHIAIIDYTKHASRRRLYIINLKTGVVTAHLTSHGRGSDPSFTGYARRFSNRAKSKMTSLGIFRTAEKYVGKHGLSMRLDGLSPSNSQARSRAIVIHGAAYVSESQSHAGRSQGCPAIDPRVRDRIFKKIGGGAMIYAYGGQ